MDEKKKKSKYTKYIIVYTEIIFFYYVRWNQQYGFRKRSWRVKEVYSIKETERIFIYATDYMN